MSPRSRLSDDLYMLYLAGLGWFLLPVYGSALAVVLPTDWDSVEDAVNLGVPMLGILGAWSGFRGGPMFVSRAGVVLELLSPTSRRALLLPRLLRQAVAWMVVAALVLSAVLGMTEGDAFGFGSALTASGIAGLAAASSSFQAVLWLVAAHGVEKELRPMVTVAAVSIPVVQIAALVSGLPFTTAAGFAVLLGTVVVGGLLAAAVLDRVPVEMLWKRASALESMRSAMLTVDFQRVFLDVRKASEQPLVGPPSTALAPAWLPMPLWRLWAAMRPNLGWHLGRVVVLAGAIAGLYWWGDLGQGLGALTVAGCTFFLGVEFSGPVAATAAQKVFLVHYPSGSGSVLRGQVVTTAVVVLVVGAATAGFGLAGSFPVVLGVVLLAALGGLAAAVQARLGSPDLAALVDRYGLALIGSVLWFRALLAPVLVFAATIAVYHQFFSHDAVTGPWLVACSVIGFVAFVVSTHPLEGSTE